MTTAERIKSMREKIGLSQQELADLVGINRVSLSQIERGNRKVSSKELSHFANVFECDPNDLLGKEISPKKEQRQKDPHYGLKQLILYISYRLAGRRNFGETVLNKLLYFADFNYFERTGKLISGEEKYIKMPYGPVPKAMGDVLDEMEKEGQIQRINSIFRGYRQKKIMPTIEPDWNYFRKVDEISKQKEENYEPYDDLPSSVEIVDDVLSKYGHRTASMLSERSHIDIPYKSTESFGEEIEPEMAFQRKKAFITNPHNLDIDEEE